MADRRRYSVLFLEDNRLDAQLVIERLLQAGFENSYTIVDDRAGFQTAFETTAFDLILSDHSLPTFDGLSALSIVRAKYGRLPFIFVTGALGEDLAVEAVLQGATDYVLKQKMERLVPAVQRALKEHEEYLRREQVETQLRLVEAKAHANSERQALLLRLMQYQRTAPSAESAMLQASQQVAEYLEVSRAGFYEVLDDGAVRFLWQWTSSGEAPNDLLTPDMLDRDRIECYRRGEIAVISDISTVENSNADTLLRTGMRAFVAVPILRSEVWRAGFFVSHHVARDWSPEEIVFLREVAEVTWDSLERARALIALEASEQRIRTAAETANLGSWDLDLTTGRMMCSNQCKSNFGWPLDRDFNYADLRAAIHPEDQAMMAEAVEKALATRTRYRAEYRNIWPDGSLHWVVASGQARYNDAGLPVQMSGFTLDVTERHKAEAALLQAEKLAAVGRLASSIAHEINNPLESVTNLLYLASTADDNETIKNHLTLADQELRRVSAITSQTLRFYRQSGRARYVSLAELAENVVGLFRRRFENSRINVCLRLRVRDEVECLDGEIRQVVTNLVSNAIDALPAGGKLAIRTRKGSLSGSEGVWLTVADDGTGILDSVQKKIFDAFFTTKDIHGTGLGLWVSRQIIDRHHGQLIFRSSVQSGNHGTVFSFFLPKLARLRRE